MNIQLYTELYGPHTLISEIASLLVWSRSMPISRGAAALIHTVRFLCAHSFEAQNSLIE